MTCPAAFNLPLCRREPAEFEKESFIRRGREGAEASSSVVKKRSARRGVNVGGCEMTKKIGFQKPMSSSSVVPPVKSRADRGLIKGP